MSEQLALLKSYDEENSGSVDDIDNVFINDNSNVTPKYSKPLSPWICFCLFTTILLSCLSLISWYLHPTKFLDSSNITRAAQLSRTNTLIRPNIYIGLDRLNKSMSLLALPKQLDVFPHVFAPVSYEEPRRVFPSDGRARLTFNGLVSPGEPHIIINKDVSMVAQVRVHDHNLERCSIVSIIPEPSKLKPQNRSLEIKNGMARLEIWELDSSGGELDLTKLSWRTKPQRVALLSDLLVEQGHESHSVKFDCGSSGTLRTFEFACKERDEWCSVEFWQEQPETKPRMAFIIVQTPSI